MRKLLLLSLLLIIFVVYLNPPSFKTNKQEEIPLPVTSIEPITESDRLSYVDNIAIDKKKNEDLKVEGVEAGSATEEIINLQKEIEKNKNEIEELTNKLLMLNTNIYTYKVEMRKAQEEKEKKEEILKDYLNLIFRVNQGYEFYFAMFNANSLKEILYNYDLTKKFIANTNEDIYILTKKHQRLDEERNASVNEKTLYQLTLDDLEKKEVALQEKYAKLELFMTNNKEMLSSESDSLKANIRNRFAAGPRYSDSYGGFMQIPVAVEYTVTSPYGDRFHPITGQWKHHAGVDLGVDYNTPVYAAAAGVVSMASWYGGYGKSVMIDHGDGIQSLYAHNNSLLVEEGQYVTQGQMIALSGSTGNSTGPHLHFEVRKDGNDIDPYTYMGG